VEATACDITDDGDLTNRRVWAEFGPLPTARFAEEAMRQVDVSPDGACLDAEGGLWIADIKGDRLLRVLEGGEVSDEIPTGIGIFACALGGSDGRTLFMCATPDFDVEARKAACDSSIRTVRVTTPAARHYQPPSRQPLKFLWLMSSAPNRPSGGQCYRIHVHRPHTRLAMLPKLDTTPVRGVPCQYTFHHALPPGLRTRSH
jgi:hypothetical protein